MFKKSLCLSALLTLSACGSEPINTFDTTAMDILLQTAVENGEVPGASALIYDDGQVVYQNAFGLRDMEREKPVEMDTLFRIYSMTKPITSALIMDLVEEGKLSLEDPVAKYIPQLGQMKVASLGDDGAPIFSKQTSPMTEEDLLLHRAGIGYGIYGPISPVEEMYQAAELFDPREDLSVKMDKLAELPLVIQPGDGWYYSYSIDVLGRVAEVATGEKLSELFTTRFFEPLGMKDTGFYVRANQKERFASNYNRDAEGNFSLQDDGQASHYLLPLPFESGGGGLVSTLEDYSKFAQMILQDGEFNGQKILNAESVNLMTANQLDSDDKILMEWLGSPDEIGFGYGGSVIIGEGENRNIGSWGWGGMAKTNFLVDRENGAYAVLMLQFFEEGEPQIHQDFRALVAKEVRD